MGHDAAERQSTHQRCVHRVQPTRTTATGAKGGASTPRQNVPLISAVRRECVRVERAPGFHVRRLLGARGWLHDRCVRAVAQLAHYSRTTWRHPYGPACLEGGHGYMRQTNTNTHGWRPVVRGSLVVDRVVAQRLSTFGSSSRSTHLSHIERRSGLSRWMTRPGAFSPRHPTATSRRGTSTRLPPPARGLACMCAPAICALRWTERRCGHSCIGTPRGGGGTHAQRKGPGADACDPAGWGAIAATCAALTTRLGYALWCDRFAGP